MGCTSLFYLLYSPKHSTDVWSAGSGGKPEKHMEMPVEHNNSDHETEENSADETEFGTPLAVIRKRRWFLWVIIFIYVPGSLTALQFTDSYRVLGLLFLIWLILLCVTVTLVACCKCPGCGNNFHMRNSTISFLRKCSHCGLHIKG